MNLIVNRFDGEFAVMKAEINRSEQILYLDRRILPADAKEGELFVVLSAREKIASDTSAGFDRPRSRPLSHRGESSSKM